jgi:hypothetical protein
MIVGFESMGHRPATRRVRWMRQANPPDCSRGDLCLRVETARATAASRRSRKAGVRATAWSARRAGGMRNGWSARSAEAPPRSTTAVRAATSRFHRAFRTSSPGPSTVPSTTVGTGTGPAGAPGTAAPRGCSGPVTRRATDSSPAGPPGPPSAAQPRPGAKGASGPCQALGVTLLQHGERGDERSGCDAREQPEQIPSGAVAADAVQRGEAVER